MKDILEKNSGNEEGLRTASPRRLIKESMDFSPAAPFVGLTGLLALASLAGVRLGLITTPEEMWASLAVIGASTAGSVVVRVLNS